MSSSNLTFTINVRGPNGEPLSLGETNTGTNPPWMPKHVFTLDDSITLSEFKRQWPLAKKRPFPGQLVHTKLQQTVLAVLSWNLDPAPEEAALREMGLSFHREP